MTTLAKIAFMHRDGTDFSDLEGDLDADLPAAQPQSAQTDTKAFEAFYGDHKAPAGEICPRCKGKGRYIVGNNFHGTRDLGPCFACGGTGAVSPEKAKAMRAHQKGKATQANNANALTRKIEEFKAANPDLIEYCNRLQNEFTSNCLAQLMKEGTMSVNRIAAIRRSLEQKAERDREQAARQVTAAPAGNGLDLSKVPAGRYAVPDGETRLKVLIEKEDKPTKWHGWIFVSDAAEYGERRKYGRQAPGKTYSGMIEKELRIIAADPKAAAIAYGKLTGHCCLCGRKLENAASVEAGIGPICAEKEGW